MALLSGPIKFLWWSLVESLPRKRQLDNLGGLVLSRLKFPFCNSAQRGIDQHGISTHHACGFDGAVGADDSLYFYDALEVHPFSEFRVIGRDTRGYLSGLGRRWGLLSSHATGQRQNDDRGNDSEFGRPWHQSLRPNS